MITKPEAVIFDIGNVLVTWRPERLYDSLMSKPKRREMFANVDLHQMNDRIDHGENWRETVYETAENYPEYRDMIRLWHDRWSEMCTPIIDESWQLLYRLKEKGVPVFALSNFGIETFAYAETLFPQFKDFDQRFISGHMGVTKPAPRIYEMVEQQCGFSGAQLFFADDRLENIEAAQKFGWQGHVFSSAKKLENALTGLDLL